MDNIVKITKYYSNGCQPCKQLTIEMGKVLIPHLIESINVDDMTKEEMLKSKVRSVPTTIFKSEGKTSVTIRGLLREPELTKIIKELY
jgi:hypothetical protein